MRVIESPHDHEREGGVDLQGCAIGRRDSSSSVRVGSGLNVCEARRCCSNTSEKGVNTAGLKTLL